MSKRLIAILLHLALLFTSLPLSITKASVHGSSGGIPIDSKTDRNKAIVTLSKSGGVTNCSVFT